MLVPLLSNSLIKAKLQADHEAELEARAAVTKTYESVLESGARARAAPRATPSSTPGSAPASRVRPRPPAGLAERDQSSRRWARFWHCVCRTPLRWLLRGLLYLLVWSLFGVAAYIALWHN